MASPILASAISVPIPLDVPGPFEAPLTQEEAMCALERVRSTPLPGDDRLRTLEKLIIVQEFNGDAHELKIVLEKLNGDALGWFRPEDSVGEVKKQISKEMCVPMEALKLVKTSSDSTVFTSNSGSSLDSGTSTASLDSNTSINAVVQMPPEYEETLKCNDDVRVHENAYDQLVTLACTSFESITSANVNLMKRIVKIIENALHNTHHKASRGWAIAALTKLLNHVINQLRLFNCKTTDSIRKEDCLENLISTIAYISKVFETLSHSDCWLERQEAEQGMTSIKAVAGSEKEVCIADVTGRRAQLGGA